MTCSCTAIRRLEHVRHCTGFSWRKLVQRRALALALRLPRQPLPIVRAEEALAQADRSAASPRSARRPRYTPARLPASTPAAARAGCSRRVDFERMFVSFFSFVGFTSMSPGREFSPTIIPSYTASPGATNSVDRSCRFASANATIVPASIDTSVPARAPRQRARPRPVLEEPVVHDAGAARVRQELRAVAEQPARRDAIQQPHHPLPRILHLEHLARDAARASRSRRRGTPRARRSSAPRTARAARRSTPSRVITRGRDTWNSYPSRRIVSIRMERCSSPRPDTVHVSVESVSSTRSATLRSSSRYSRSRSWRDVTNFPSLPANGELLTRKSTEIVGSSTAMPSSRSGCSTSVTVSPISTPSSPASATISPAARLLDLDAVEPLVAVQLRHARALTARARAARLRAPAMGSSATASPTRTVPRSMRPIASRPRYGE